MEIRRGQVIRFDTVTTTGLVDVRGVGHAFSSPCFDATPSRFPRVGELVDVTFGDDGEVFAVREVRAVPEGPRRTLRRFDLEGSELRAADAWVAEHRRDAHGGAWPEMVIGGALTYGFTSTSLGDVIVVRCYCGAEKDVTDYDLW